MLKGKFLFGAVDRKWRASEMICWIGDLARFVPSWEVWCWVVSWTWNTGGERGS